jgi:hypothetical protein
MNKYKISFLIAATALFCTSCTKNFESINTNPAKITQAGPTEIPFMFSDAESAATIQRSYYQTISILMPDIFAQYYALTTTSFQTDRYALNDTWLSRPGIVTYVLTLPQLQTIFNVTKPTSGEYALANIMYVYVFHRLTDYFGPVPYFHAGESSLSIPYDPQDSIYADMFKRLDSAVNNLKALNGANVFGTADVIYGGNTANWIVFANTLRLRLALRISNVDPDMAKQQAEAAVSSGVMTESSQSAYIQRSLNGDDANGLSFNAADNEFSMSSTMASYLKGYADPRLSVYFQPAVTTGLYKGLRNGSPATAINEPGNRPAQTSNVGTRWATWSTDANAWVANLAVSQPVLHAAEAYFLRAEGALNGWNMGGTAQELYETGISISMEEWGITDPTVVNNYINSTALPTAPGDEAGSPAVSNTPIKWGTSVAVQRAEIGTQKWLCLFPDGVEGWAEFRRSGYPVMYPLLESDNADLPVGTFIKRLPYSSVDAATNGIELAKAQAMLGGPDNAATRLWWDVQ